MKINDVIKENTSGAIAVSIGGPNGGNGFVGGGPGTIKRAPRSNQPKKKNAAKKKT